MTEQPPSAEAMRLAGGVPNPIGLATAIDALCEQRVSAETERCALAARGGDHSECQHEAGYMDGRLDAEAAIRVPAERPAPPQLREILGDPRERVTVPGAEQKDSLRGIGVEQRTRHTDQPGCGTALPREDYPPILDEMLPLADEAARTVAVWFRASWHLGRPLKNDGPELNEDLLAVIGEATFGALQRFAGVAKLVNAEGLNPVHSAGSNPAAGTSSSVPFDLASTGEQPDCGGFWRPIESAPKDGSRIIISDGDVPAVGLWQQSSQRWVVDWDHEPYEKPWPTIWCPLPEAMNTPSALASTGAQPETEERKMTGREIIGDDLECLAILKRRVAAGQATPRDVELSASLTAALNDSGFHWKYGTYFKRMPDGSVRLRTWREAKDGYPTYDDRTIDPASWASIVCSVSAEGETGERWNAAQDFHGRVLP